jgi:hypothetical protein
MIHVVRLPATGAVFNLEFDPWEYFLVVPVQFYTWSVVLNLDFGAERIKLSWQAAL